MAVKERQKKITNDEHIKRHMERIKESKGGMAEKGRERDENREGRERSLLSSGC